MVWPLRLARNGPPCPDLTLLRALRHLKATLMPEALDALVVDDLSLCPQQSMDTRGAKTRMLLLDLFKLLPQSLIVTRMWSVACAGTRDLHQTAGLTLGKAAFCGLRDQRPRFC